MLTFYKAKILTCTTSVNNKIKRFIVFLIIKLSLNTSMFSLLIRFVKVPHSSCKCKQFTLLRLNTRFPVPKCESLIAKPMCQSCLECVCPMDSGTRLPGRSIPCCDLQSTKDIINGNTESRSAKSKECQHRAGEQLASYLKNQRILWEKQKNFGVVRVEKEGADGKNILSYRSHPENSKFVYVCLQKHKYLCKYSKAYILISSRQKKVDT